MGTFAENLRALLEDFQDVGPERRLATVCERSALVEETRRQFGVEAAHAALHDNFSWYRETPCLSEGSCLGCPDGRSIIEDGLGLGLTGTGFLDRHVRLALEQYTREGDRRKLPGSCSVGAVVGPLYEGAHVIDTQGPAARLAEAYGCFSQLSCGTCELGKKALVDLLLDLNENGLEGAYGSTL